MTAGIAACQWLVSLSGDPLASVPLDEAGADVSDAPDAATPDAGTFCGREVAPRPPTTPQGPSTSQHVVLRRVNPFLDAGRGFDLDCVNTQCGAPEGTPETSLSCVPRAGAQCQDVIDDVGGIDNQVVALGARRAARLDQTRYHEFVDTGQAGIVIALLGYSGEADDSDVSVAIFPTGGCLENNRCENLADASVGAPREPRFNGCDVYWGDPDHVNSFGLPIKTSPGYVRGYTLVVRGPVPGWAYYGSRPVAVEGQILEAVLSRVDVPDGGGALRFAMRGTFAGRVAPDEILRVFGEQKNADGGDNRPLCFQSSWDLIRQVVCMNVDLPALGAKATDPCSALSFQFDFEGAPILLSTNSTAAKVSPSLCLFDGGALDASTFTCP